MKTLKVVHRTVYRYARPVEFGEHRLMFRPRDSHDLRLLDTRLTLRPTASVRWLHDVFGNSIAIATFSESGSELFAESSFRAQHYPLPLSAVTIEPHAVEYPFSYSADEIADLGRTIERHYPDPGHKVDAWARRFVAENGPGTMDILLAMTRHISETFSYSRREEMGTQDPLTTLDLMGGSCRDYALLMMEAVRSLGFAARFVSGYLYGEAPIGVGETHAWIEVFLPGAGWVEFDPTNALVGGRNLIRVAVARDPSQAVPMSGSFTGGPEDFLGLSVEVTVTAEGH
jgi:transglutaminase-like putative cysteine protease